MPASPRASLAPYEEYPLYEVLQRTASRFPNKTAVVDGERSFTFADLEEQSDKCAVALTNIGVEQGDRVGLFAPNCAEFVTAYFGILKAGAVVTPVNAAYRARELRHQLNNSGVRVLVSHEATLPVVESARADLITLDTVINIGSSGPEVRSYDEFLNGAQGRPPTVSNSPKEDIAALPSSSGTTGLPKGVMLTHFNLTSNVEQTLNRPGEVSSITEDDVLLVHLPLFHSYGMTVLMNTAIAAGATQVHMGRFDMESFLDLVPRHRISMLFTVPPVVLGVAQVPGIESHDLSSIRLCLSGAAPLSEELQSRFESFTGVPTVQGYGLTETSPVTNMDYVERERRRPGSIGPALSDTDEKVVDPEDASRELAAGEVGELLIRGPQVMKGYWRNPEATDETIRDGWLYTGDMARMDADGYVYIVDRKKELIKYKGFQVAPAEMEALLLEHPDIADVAVVGKPDEEAGELPKAYIVSKDTSLTADNVMGFVAERVAGFKKIREVEFIDEIPKSPSGKILRRVLSDLEKAL